MAPKRKEHKVENRIEVKWCNTCKRWLDLSLFGKSSPKWDGLTNKCKMCYRLYSRNNKERNKQISKKYYDSHKDECHILQKKYYKEQHEVILIRAKDYRDTHKELCLLNSYKNGARRRGLDFLLTDDEFYILIKQTCFYCGIAPSPCNGVDRMNNDLGYFKDNVVTCCSECNSAKSKRPFLNFLNWVKRISKYQVTNA